MIDFGLPDFGTAFAQSKVGIQKSQALHLNSEYHDETKT